MKKINLLSNKSLIIIMFLYLFINNAKATILEKLTTEQLTQKSSFIVVGIVTDIQYTKDQNTGLINTFVKIAVENYVKGSSDKKEIEVSFPGGVFDGKKIIIDGTPKFKLYERVMVFTYLNKKNQYRVVGWHQGKYTIENDLILETKTSLINFISTVKKAIK
jgi:hypothetical protein